MTAKTKAVAKKAVAKRAVAKKSAASKPSAAKSSAVEPALVKSAATKPVATKPGATKSGATKSAATESASTRSAPKSSASAKPGKRALVDRLAEIAIPTDAWALSRIKPGVGVTPHVDALLALGFPHMVCVVDEPLPSMDPKKALRSYTISRIVSRELLPRLLAYKRGWTAEEANAGFLAEPKPFELASVIEDELGGCGWDRIWMLEAMFGSVAVAEAFVDGYVKLPRDEWFDGPVETWGNTVIAGLGTVLDRTPAATRERLRGELATLYARLEGIDESSRALAQLDVVLHGREGLERSGERSNGGYYTTDYHWARDDAKWLEAQVLADVPTWKPRERRWFDAQLAFSGGPKVLAALRKVAAGGVVTPDHRAAVAEQLALFA